MDAKRICCIQNMVQMGEPSFILLVNFNMSQLLAIVDLAKCHFCACLGLEGYTSTMKVEGVRRLNIGSEVIQVFVNFIIAAGRAILDSQ